MTFPVKQWIVPGLAALGAAWLAWTLKPTPAPTYRDVVVHDSVILKEAPDTVLRFVDRIKWRVMEPTVIARGDSAVPERLAAYCGPDTVSDSVSPPMSDPVLPPSSGKYDGSRLALFSVTSDGRLFAQETPAKAPFEWVNRGGVYEVREQRAPFRLWNGLPGTAAKGAVIVGSFLLGRASK